jgi:hypothetical protein
VTMMPMVKALQLLEVFAGKEREVSVPSSLWACQLKDLPHRLRTEVINEFAHC